MLNIQFRCKWCGRSTGGDRKAARIEEVESCAFCAHLAIDERRAIEALPDDAEVTQSILALVMENPPSIETVTGWTNGQRRAAEDWAGREHLYASDNLDVDRVRRPDFVFEEAQ
jgi:ribosome-binding protein aMBF1 (putative translation factor)